MKNRVSGVMDQVATVQVRNNFHPRRQNAIVQLLDLRVDGFERWLRSCTFTEQQKSLNYVLVIDYMSVFAAYGLADLAEPNFLVLAELQRHLSHGLPYHSVFLILSARYLPRCQTSRRRGR